MKGCILVALHASLVAGASSISDGPCGLKRADCFYKSHKDVTAMMISHGRRLAAANVAADQCSDAKVLATALKFCSKMCPSPEQVDFTDTCMDHASHGFLPTFSEKASGHNSLQWNIFFLIMCFLLGAQFKLYLPKWMPYTVGLLILGMILGLIAESLAQAKDCPMYALLYDIDGDGAISRSEYQEFTGVGWHLSSMCMSWKERTSQMLSANAAYFTSVNAKISSTRDVRTCGDGSANPSGCRYTFDALDGPYKLSDMHAEYAVSSGSGGHRRALAAASGSSSGNEVPGRDGKLTPDELWTPQCNLMMDIISLQNIDPHVMLVVFLPALLFESACFGVDMGIFRKQVVQILLLAFPAMIVASGITAACLYALTPSVEPGNPMGIAVSTNWSFWVCWLIGVIGSATDPVAVVALLKELGASKELGTLIEGESLLNDGSAVVLFTWIRNAIGYGSATLAPGWMRGDGTRFSGEVGTELVRIVAQMLLLGIALGIGLGWLTKNMLRFVYNDRCIEGMMIIAMSYLAFWLGELIMGSSAVLAVVSMGLYFNMNKSIFSPPVLHFLHEFYEMIAHLLNTIIFLIAGCKLGSIIMDSQFHDLFLAGSGALGMIIGIYPIILFARGAAIALMFPLLSRLGTGCTWKDAVVMWWGGLRGSVGLALGLAVHHSLLDKNMWGEGQADRWGSVGLVTFSLDCRDQPNMVLVLTVLIVVTTVIINGMTMAPLMRLLKLTEVPDDRVYMLQAAKLKLKNLTDAFISSRNASVQGTIDGPSRSRLAPIKWEEVRDFSSQWLVRMADGGGWDNPVRDPQKAAWLMLLNCERAHYLGAFEHGTLGGKAYKVLQQFIEDICAMAKHTDIARLGELYDERFRTHLIDLIQDAKRVPPATAFEIGSNYLFAMDHVKHTLHKAASGSSQHQLPQYQGIDIVEKELEDNIALMRETLDKIRSDHADAVDTFQILKLKESILYEQRTIVGQMLHHGELLDLDGGPMLTAIDDELKHLYLHPLRTFLGIKIVLPGKDVNAREEGLLVDDNISRVATNAMTHTASAVENAVTHTASAVEHEITSAARRARNSVFSSSSRSSKIHAAPDPDTTVGSE